MARELTDQDYRNLLAFRTSLRRFFAWSADHDKSADLTPAQHQLLLAIRGIPSREALRSGISPQLLIRGFGVRAPGAPPI
jgi:hypothetical protein